MHTQVRADKNERVKEKARMVIKDCKAQGYTIADMEDLSIALQGEINRSIIAAKEKCQI